MFNHQFTAPATKKTHPAEFNIWRRIRERCTRSACRKYKDYGGRGIRICERWRLSFAAFVEDLGPRPTPAHSVDRINNNGFYSPENCRWATPKQQGRNRRDNHVIEWNGRTKCLTEWAEELGMSRGLLTCRIRRWGVTVAFTKPVRPNWRMLCHAGRTQSMTDWARELGLCPAALRWRIKAWGVDRALTRRHEV